MVSNSLNMGWNCIGGKESANTVDPKTALPHSITTFEKKTAGSPRARTITQQV